jgi:hypothetical protein
VAAGVRAVISVSETTVTSVAAAPPTVTAAPTRKPAPPIVIGVPPVRGPLVGSMLVTLGADQPVVS